MDDITIAVISNITEIDPIAGLGAYNIELPLINPITNNKYYMQEGHTYRLDIRIDNLQNCDENSDPSNWPAIPSTEYPGAPSIIGIQQDSFSGWYYFNNITVYIGEDNIPNDEDPSLCVPIVQLCVSEPVVIDSIEHTEIPTHDPTINPPQQPLDQGQTDNPSIDPTNTPTINPTEMLSETPTNDPTEDTQISDPTVYPTTIRWTN